MSLNDINSLSHTKWNCKYHIVFAPKYRRKVFYKEKRAAIGKILRQLCEWKSVKIIEAEACPDHIHLFVEIPPKLSVSGFMGYLKGKSSTMLYPLQPQNGTESDEQVQFAVCHSQKTVCKIRRSTAPLSQSAEQRLHCRPTKSEMGNRYLLYSHRAGIPVSFHNKTDASGVETPVPCLILYILISLLRGLSCAVRSIRGTSVLLGGYFFLGQHRIIRRERAARDFAIKNRRFPAAILCVLQGEATTFQRKSAAGRR